MQTLSKHTQREGLYALSIRSRGVGGQQPCTPWQPHMSPGNHACPPATMHTPGQPHTPWATTHAPPTTTHAPSNHTCPPGNHACPLATMHAPQQPHMPLPATTHPTSNHAHPPGTMHTPLPPATMHTPGDKAHPQQPHIPPGNHVPPCQQPRTSPPPVDRILDTRF